MVERTVKMEQGNELNLEQVRELELFVERIASEEHRKLLELDFET